MEGIGIGMIGYKFMGRAHTHAYRDLPFYFPDAAVPDLRAISGRNLAAVNQAADKMGWKSVEGDWRKMLERDDIDVIDIVTPNNSHVDMAIAAVQAGKHVICEKPLALSVGDARRMRDAARRNNVVHMISHNYRFAPAVQYAKKLIESGVLGKIYHVRAQYLQDWLADPNSPMSWRLQKEVTGTGALGDIGAHIIDLARFLIGEFEDVTSMMKTFTHERPYPDGGGTGKVTVDDAVAFLAHMEGDVFGTFEATRNAMGNLNGNRFEINGEKGSIRWDLENMNNLDVYLADDETGLRGFHTINCTGEEYPFGEHYWPSGHIIGYEHTFINMMATFMEGVRAGHAPEPNFDDGLQGQMVMEAVEESARSGRWVRVGGF